MGGSYATAALNTGAAGGPVVAAATSRADAGGIGPVWGSVVLVAVALLIALPLRRVAAPAPARRAGGRVAYLSQRLDLLDLDRTLPAAMNADPPRAADPDSRPATITRTSSIALRRLRRLSRRRP
jgi:uncharacterized membrane protein